MSIFFHYRLTLRWYTVEAFILVISKAFLHNFYELTILSIISTFYERSSTQFNALLALTINKKKVQRSFSSLVVIYNFSDEIFKIDYSLVAMITFTLSIIINRASYTTTHHLIIISKRSMPLTINYFNFIACIKSIIRLTSKCYFSTYLTKYDCRFFFFFF